MICSFFFDEAVTHDGERGSFIVAYAFMFFLLMALAGGFGVDLSRYYMKQQSIQQVADGAALAGAQALNQFTDTPDREEARKAIMNYLRDRLSEEQFNVYGKLKANTVEDFVEIQKFNKSKGGNCSVNFSISNGSVTVNQPFNTNSEVLGSAVTTASGNRNFPVTAKLTISDSAGNVVRELEPWGNWDDPQGADLNNPSNKPTFNLPNLSEGASISAEARLYYPKSRSDGYRKEKEKTSHGVDVKVLRDGDPVPETEGGFSQKSAAEYVSNFVSNGKMNLGENQAIYLFELTHNASADRADFQDLVLLNTMTPASSGGGGGSSSGSSGSVSSGSSSGGCQFDSAYRVGVQTFTSFRPYFLPQAVFGRQEYAISRIAVAEVNPVPLERPKQNIPMECGVFADKTLTISGNNLNASNTNICSNTAIEAGASSNGRVKKIFVPENHTLNPPGGDYREKVWMKETKPVPTFNRTNRQNYDVDLANFDSWNDLGVCQSNCNTPGWCTPYYAQHYSQCQCSTRKKALRTQSSPNTANVEWSGNGNAVCAAKDASTGNFIVQANNAGQIQQTGGSPISIFSNRTVVLDGNGLGLNGGLYSTKGIEILGNSHTFNGTVNVKGGLALWGFTGLNIEGNNVDVDGILGSGTDLRFGSKGGGTGPTLDGVAIAGGNFSLLSNSNNATLNYSPSMFNTNVLSGYGKLVVNPSPKPVAYSTVRARLIK
jgi:hypothetical protein